MVKSVQGPVAFETTASETPTVPVSKQSQAPRWNYGRPNMDWTRNILDTPTAPNSKTCSKFKETLAKIGRAVAAFFTAIVEVLFKNGAILIANAGIFFANLGHRIFCCRTQQAKKPENIPDELPDPTKKTGRLPDLKDPKESTPLVSPKSPKPSKSDAEKPVFFAPRVRLSTIPESSAGIADEDAAIAELDDHMLQQAMAVSLNLCEPGPVVERPDAPFDVKNGDIVSPLEFFQGVEEVMTALALEQEQQMVKPIPIKAQPAPLQDIAPQVQMYGCPVSPVARPALPLSPIIEPALLSLRADALAREAQQVVAVADPALPAAGPASPAPLIAAPALPQVEPGVVQVPMFTAPVSPVAAPSLQLSLFVASAPLPPKAAAISSEARPVAVPASPASRPASPPDVILLEWPAEEVPMFIAPTPPVAAPALPLGTIEAPAAPLSPKPAANVSQAEALAMENPASPSSRAASPVPLVADPIVSGATLPPSPIVSPTSSRAASPVSDIVSPSSRANTERDPVITDITDEPDSPSSRPGSPGKVTQPAVAIPASPILPPFGIPVSPVAGPALPPDPIRAQAPVLAGTGPVFPPAQNNAGATTRSNPTPKKFTFEIPLNGRKALSAPNSPLWLGLDLVKAPLSPPKEPGTAPLLPLVSVSVAADGGNGTAVDEVESVAAEPVELVSPRAPAGGKPLSIEIPDRAEVFVPEIPVSPLSETGSGEPASPVSSESDSEAAV